MIDKDKKFINILDDGISEILDNHSGNVDSLLNELESFISKFPEEERSKHPLILLPIKAILSSKDSAVSYLNNFQALLPTIIDIEQYAIETSAILRDVDRDISNLNEDIKKINKEVVDEKVTSLEGFARLDELRDPDNKSSAISVINTNIDKFLSLEPPHAESQSIQNMIAELQEIQDIQKSFKDVKDGFSKINEDVESTALSVSNKLKLNSLHPELWDDIKSLNNDLEKTRKDINKHINKFTSILKRTIYKITLGVFGDNFKEMKNFRSGLDKALKVIINHERMQSLNYYLKEEVPVNYYAILGVEENADNETIKRSAAARRNMLERFSDRKYRSLDDKKMIQDSLKIVHDAERVLLGRFSRSTHDAYLKTLRSDKEKLTAVLANTRDHLQANRALKNKPKTAEVGGESSDNVQEIQALDGSKQSDFSEQAKRSEHGANASIIDKWGKLLAAKEERSLSADAQFEYFVQEMTRALEARRGEYSEEEYTEQLKHLMDGFEEHRQEYFHDGADDNDDLSESASEYGDDEYMSAVEGPDDLSSASEINEDDFGHGPAHNI